MKEESHQNVASFVPSGNDDTDTETHRTPKSSKPALSREPKPSKMNKPTPTREPTPPKSTKPTKETPAIVPALPKSTKSTKSSKDLQTPPNSPNTTPARSSRSIKPSKPMKPELSAPTSTSHKPSKHQATPSLPSPSIIQKGAAFAAVDGSISRFMGSLVERWLCDESSQCTEETNHLQSTREDSLDYYPSDQPHWIDKAEKDGILLSMIRVIEFAMLYRFPSLERLDRYTNAIEVVYYQMKQTPAIGLFDTTIRHSTYYHNFRVRHEDGNKKALRQSDSMDEDEKSEMSTLDRKSRRRLRMIADNEDGVEKTIDELELSLMQRKFVNMYGYYDHAK